MITSTQQAPTYGTRTSPGTKIPSGCISEAGCYVCDWSGHLLRVARGGRSAMLSIVGQQPLFVTKLSDDPYIPLAQAMLLASNAVPRRTMGRSSPAKTGAATKKVNSKLAKRSKKVTKRSATKRKTTTRPARRARPMAKKKKTRR